jgi:predicted Zn-dependent peptidase
VTHDLTQLPSGLRVVTERMDSVRSVAAGIFIGTGSALEAEPQAGLSHLLEHMLFRGTRSFASIEIDQLFDAMGAEINAGTGKESTSVYTRVLDVHLDRAMEAMAEMVWHPRLAEDDLAQERQIVLEEVAMYEDEPGDRVFDVLGEAVFGSHPLGRAIIGTPEVISGTRAEGLRDFWAGRYGPANVVVAAAGSVDHDALVAQVGRVLDGAPATSDGLPAHSVPEAVAPARRFLTKETEQYHVCVGGTGIARDDDRRFALRVLDAILGGTPSSRLFQEVRENRGLAYSVYSFTSLHAGTGQVGLYLGTRPDNVAKALGVVGDELERLRSEPVPADELARARDHVKGRIVLGLESTAARMSRLGSSLLAGLPVMPVDEVLERLDAVTGDDLAALAGELLVPSRLSAAGIGGDEDAFRAALEPVAPALAA